jgi:hypothetical protein
MLFLPTMLTRQMGQGAKKQISARCLDLKLELTTMSPVVTWRKTCWMVG